MSYWVYRQCVCRRWRHNLDNLLCLRPVVLFTKDFAYSSYRTSSNLKKKKHIKTHNNTVQMFCPDCPYSTFKKKLLRGHIYIQHTSKDRFLCDECSFTTNTNQGIKRHKERVHCHPRLSALKPTELIYCDQCEYSTTINRNLKHHVLVYHMGVRYPCDHCEFQAKDKSNLKRHTLSTHEGVRYSCDQCDYKATQTSSLKLHKESKHEGIKYQCDQCSFMASRQDNLTIHKKIKHSDEVHYCVHCTFRTKVHSRLNTHLKNVHFITNEDNWINKVKTSVHSFIQLNVDCRLPGIKYIIYSFSFCRFDNNPRCVFSFLAFPFFLLIWNCCLKRQKSPICGRILTFLVDSS